MRTVRLTVTVEGEGGGARERNGDSWTMSQRKYSDIKKLGSCPSLLGPVGKWGKWEVASKVETAFSLSLSLSLSLSTSLFSVNSIPVRHDTVCLAKVSAAISVETAGTRTQIRRKVCMCVCVS